MNDKKNSQIEILFHVSIDFITSKIYSAVNKYLKKNLGFDKMK